MTHSNHISFLKGSKENWSTKNEQKNLEKAQEYAKRQEYQEEAEAQQALQQKLPWVSNKQES